MAVATAFTAALGPDALHLYAIGHGQAMAELAALPHTGAVVDLPHDVEVHRPVRAERTQQPQPAGEATS